MKLVFRMRLLLALALILSLAGLPAAAVSVCQACELDASSGCCCHTEHDGEGESFEGDGVIPDCGCSMRRAPEPPAAPDPAPTTERIKVVDQPASAPPGAGICPATASDALHGEGTASRALFTHVTLCTFRC